MSGHAAARIARCEVTTALGVYTLAATVGGICYVSLDPERTDRELAAWRERFEASAEIGEPEAGSAQAAGLESCARQLVEWGAGARRRFEVALDLRGTEFQLACWAELQRIPCGETRTYGEVAERVGRPGAARAVGAANGANPVPVIVPCHRVVASDGLGGFGGGLERKRQMLELEGALLPFG